MILTKPFLTRSSGESISCSPIAGFAETSRAAGNHLIVDMGNSQYALYAHLEPYSVTAQVGDVVAEVRNWAC
jgi:hypothetical protein